MPTKVNLPVNTPRTRQSAEQYAVLIRPQMVVLPLIIYLVVLSAKDGLSFTAGVLGWLMFLCAYGIVTIHNNMSDVNVDIANNRTNNPLASGSISKQGAQLMLYSLIILGVSVAILINVFALIWLGVYVFLGWLYSGKLELKSRGFLALIILAICYGVMPWALGYISSTSRFDYSFVIAAIASFIYVIGIINLKDFKDVSGDRAHGKMTILAKKGEVFAQRFILLFTTIGYYAVISYASLCNLMLLSLLGFLLCFMNIFYIANNQMITSSKYRARYGSFLRIVFFLYVLIVWSIATKT